MMKAIVFAIGLAIATPAYAQNSVIWTLDRKPDPITDKMNSIAMPFGEGDTPFAIRCKNSSAIDAFISTKTPNRVGTRLQVIIRFGSNPPETFPAVATDRNLIAIDLRDRKEVFSKFMTTDPVAIRYVNQDDREITFTWRAPLKPNVIHVVGQTLADCGVIPYPQAEFDAASKEVTNQSPAGKPSKKRPK